MSPMSPTHLFRPLEIQYGERLGSPRYPTHMDYMRGSRRQPLDVSSSLVCQDVPEEEEEASEDVLVGLPTETPPVTSEKFKGDSLNSYSFSSPYSKRGTFITASRPSSSRSSVRSPMVGGSAELGGSSSAHLSHSELSPLLIPHDSDGPLFPTALRNPNKALLTIDMRTSEILIANDVVYPFFGYRPTELVGTAFEDLLAYGPSRVKHAKLMEENVDSDGHVVMVPGRVVSSSFAHISLPKTQRKQVQSIPLERFRALKITDTVTYWRSRKSARILRVPHGQTFQQITDTVTY